MTVLSFAVPVALWAAVLMRAPAARRDGRKRLLWVALTGLAIYATLDLPSVAVTVDGVATETTNLSHLIKYLVALVAAVAAYEVVRHGYFPPKVASKGWRRRVMATAAFAAVLVPLFILSPVREQQTDSLVATYSSAPTMAAFLSIFYLAMGTILGSIVRHTIWYCQQLPHGSLRTSMAIIAAGAGFGLVFVAFQLALVALTPAFPATVATVAPSPLGAFMLTACLALIALGTGWRLITGRAVDEWLTALGGYRDLRQLWRDLHDVVPSISLEDALSRDGDGRATLRRRGSRLVGRHELRLRYRRRVVEILDGELALRPYVSEEAVRAAHEATRTSAVSEGRRSATAQRAVLEVARRRRARGEQPIASTSRPRSPAATTFEEEAERLLAIARSRSDGLKLADLIDHPEPSTTIAR
ncbi:MAB_1171c family putative transporter [Pseudokineococcus sp. 5B2Z-1]|uniref:MAB_1171c family putative transporter n=1 Tax=Pseudokineococcus sp. 5B2Z-1 TaxID=3132744 RepID=UPI0030A56197